MSEIRQKLKDIMTCINELIRCLNDNNGYQCEHFQQFKAEYDEYIENLDMFLCNSYDVQIEDEFLDNLKKHKVILTEMNSAIEERKKMLTDKITDFIVRYNCETTAYDTIEKCDIKITELTQNIHTKKQTVDKVMNFKKDVTAKWRKACGYDY